MDFDPDFGVVQDFSVAIPDAPLDVDLRRHDVDGRCVVVGVGVAVVRRRREGELFDSVDFNKWQIEGTLVHVSGAVEVPEVVQARRLPDEDQVELQRDPKRSKVTILLAGTKRCVRHWQSFIPD